MFKFILISIPIDFGIVLTNVDAVLKQQWDNVKSMLKQNWNDVVQSW